MFTPIGVTVGEISVKGTFHYSSQLQTWLSTRFAARFRQVRAGLRHAFDQLSTLLSKTWSRTAAGSLVRARARQMECRKPRFKQVRSWLSTFDLLATRFSTKFAAG